MKGNERDANFVVVVRRMWMYYEACIMMHDDKELEATTTIKQNLRAHVGCILLSVKQQGAQCKC
eukprot:15365259-Ditylum_brightwellii.AAC.2